MQLSSDIIYQHLSEKFHVIASGNDIPSLILEPPIFWYEGIEYREGMICVGRSDEMTELSGIRQCLQICVGGGRSRTQRQGRGCLFSIVDEIDLFHVFNCLQAIFRRYERWKENLQMILHTSADIQEMLQITVALLHDPISFCNKNLELVASAFPEGMEAPGGATFVSAEKVKQFSGTHERDIALREPFLYHWGKDDIYCMNIYKQDSYQGLLTIANSHVPHTRGQIQLFQFFYAYVSEAVGKLAESGKGNLVTLKQVFKDILDCIPVSDMRMKNALLTVDKKKQCWVCLAVQQSEAITALPSEYLCVQIEQQLPGCQALRIDAYMAILVPVVRTGALADALPGKLRDVVTELFTHAGISVRFQDLRKARLYFRQAVAALETGRDMGREEILYYFQQYALYYGLGNSMGEFTAEYMLPEGLQQLLEEDEQSGYDGWKTLKTYLDNELNATQTAKDLYIHRTTLQNRMRRIEKLVDLTTAESRLYLRYGIYLVETFGNKHKME